jgi:hypothetical protein
MKIHFAVSALSLAFLLLMIAPAIAQEGPDEWEPNDTSDQANSISTLYFEGEIGRRGDYDDWFVLEGQEGYHPTITLRYDDDDCDIDLEVYSGNDYVGSLTAVSSPDADTFDVPSVCYIHVYAYEGRGEYSIEILPSAGDYDRDDHRGSRCEGPDEWEPNNQPELADLVEGYYIEGYACRDDVDWYELQGQEGVNPTITIYYDERECDVDIDIYSDDELVGTLSSSESPDGDTFHITGDCMLMVEAYSGEGSYEIEIDPAGRGRGRDHDREGRCEGPDEWESNDTRDLADLISGLTIEGYACEDDDDWFMLEGQEGRRPRFTLYYSDRDCDIDMDIFSDDELVGSLVSVDSPDRDSFRVPGTCYLHVYAYDGEGEYTIEIEP